MAEETLYDILQVTKSASQEVIKSAYKTLLSRIHPDTNPDEDGVMFQRVKAAYAILSDPEKREDYDSRIYVHSLEEVLAAESGASPSQKLRTVKKLNGEDTWCTLDEHIMRKGMELAETDLQDIRLENVELKSADLKGCCLDRAKMKDVILTSADLTKTRCTGGVFQDCTFTGARFYVAHYEDCQFKNCDFSNANFIKCFFRRCIFENVCVKSANLIDTSFEGSFLGQVEFRQKQTKEFQVSPLKIQNVSFKNANLVSAHFEKKILKEGSFFNEPTYEQKSLLTSCDFTGSNLSRADFSHVELSDCSFDNAILNGVNFHGATIRNADMRSCSLIDTRFHEARVYKDVLFPGAYKLPVEQIEIKTAKSKNKRGWFS